jgi:hypothetical protein
VNLLKNKAPSGQPTDPDIARKAAQRAAKIATEDTFEAIAREWIFKERKGLAPRYVALLLARPS